MKKRDIEYGKKIIKVMLLLAFFCAAAALIYSSNTAFSLTAEIFAAVLAAGAIIAVFIYCRCPRCGKVIFFGFFKVTVFPKCKCDLRTGKKVKKSKIRYL